MATTEVSYPTSYNRELTLDLTLEAFSVYNFDHAGFPRVHDYVPVSKSVIEFVDAAVLDSSGVIVTDSGGATVTVSTSTTTNRTRDSRLGSFKYLCTDTTTNWTLAEYRDYTFTDWVGFDSTGEDFRSYLITGYEISQDFLRKKQAIYLVVHCDRTEGFYTLSGADIALARQSSCLVQAQWDWNNSADHGKWGTQFEAYRLFLPQNVSPSAGDTFEYGARVIKTKNKLRGSGDALSIKFENTTGKDMKLLGWGVEGYKVDAP